MSASKFVSFQITDLQSNSINNVNINNDLVLVHEKQTITGKKVFKTVVLEADSTIGLINGVNLSIFNDHLLRIGNQEMKSKNFKRNVIMKDLTASGYINGVPVSDIVTVQGGQILGSRILNNVTFNRIKAENVEVTGSVNNIILEDMIKDTMTYNGKLIFSLTV